MKNTKRNSRIIAFQIAYQKKKVGLSFYSEEYLLKKELNKEAKEYIKSLLEVFFKKEKIINHRIQTALIGWKQERISSTLNRILQLATAEKFLSPKLAPSIIISEYLEITRIFAGEQAVKLCNAILSKTIIVK